MAKPILLTLLTGGVLLFGTTYSDDDLPTISITQGNLVGCVYNSSYGTFYAFQGIPYAKPPLGELRFKPPVAPEPWTGIYDASEVRSKCLQMRMRVVGDEDCLFLNVYTPQLPDPNKLLSVMVWIHGGGFASGSGDLELQGPDFLLNDGVVYVSINYRLSALGFLSTGDEAAPGNMGMKDQVMALRWVKENIAAFGGDPSKVTIFGESAGGASASFHVLSPMSAGLFRSAIFQSGSAMNQWAVRDNDTARATAFLLGKTLGYKGNSSKELVNFLRTTDAENLTAAAAFLKPEFDKYRVVVLCFVPVVEPVVKGVVSFLPDTPAKILAQGKFNKVPVLAGTNSGESILFLAMNGMLSGTITPESINRNFTKILKPELRFCKTQPCGDEMVTRIKSFYFGDENVTKDNLQQLIDLLTDMMFAEGTMFEVDKLASHGSSPVYLYELTYESKLSFKKYFPESMNYTGASHGDDVFYIFKTFASHGPTEDMLRQKITAMWTNFAKYGNPTPDSSSDLPKWIPYRTSATNYLDIGAELTMKTDFQKSRMDFWRQLYKSS